MAKIETIIGKDVIESLTLGMYEDARFIYREYIQNSADQIDKAVEMGLIDSKEEGRIEIKINKEKRIISFEDNATGIKAKKVLSTLRNIAQSSKDRSKNKGFRGIGRLGGLGYCNKLIFETSYKGEDKKSTLTWDTRALKAIINDRSRKETASEVIDAVTSLKTEKTPKDERYFKVILEQVSSDILLDESGICKYLSMVAPVPYPKGFIYKSEIYKKAKSLKFDLDEYPIYVNRKNQLFKAYTTSLYEGEENNKKKFDKIHNIEFLEIKNTKSELIAWGWYSISTFKKQLPVVNAARGIRLRKGNIQIGLEECLEKLFKEKRGNSYFFGEIHAVNPMLIPNARRDYFLENEVLFNLEIELRLIFERLHQLYHFSSKVRNSKRKIDDFIEFSEELKEKQEKGFTDEKERKSYLNIFETKKDKAKVAEEQLNRAEAKISQDQSAKQKVFETVVQPQEKTKVDEVEVINSNHKPKFITDEITSLSKKDRKLVSRIFSVIDNVLPKEISNILKDKIKEELQ